MPIYEYVCPSCKTKFELLRPMSRATEKAPCPQCRQKAERVLSTFSGFAIDEAGLSSAVSGNTCASCGAASCDTCNT